MDEDTILQFSKDLTLNYLDEINADVKERDGIYYVTLPLTIAKLFGGERKKITFKPDIAATHAYELVVPGSNFLSTVIREVQKQAPVVVGSIPKNTKTSLEITSKINVKDSQIEIIKQDENEQLGIRFYFYITLKSIKNVSSLQWIDFDLESLALLELPFKLNFNEKKIKLDVHGKKFDDAYTRAIKEFENNMMPQVEKYVKLTKQDKDEEIRLLNFQEQVRSKEIKDELKGEKDKLKELDQKILRARSTDARSKYWKKKELYKKRMTDNEDNALDHIEKITRDKQISLEHINQKYRPDLTFSLLGAQIYSYSVLNCTLSIKKRSKSVHVNAQYIDPTENVVLHCDICRNENDDAHLCENLHLTCDKCIKKCLKCNNEFCLKCASELNPCYICKDEFCNNCLKTCEFCSEVTCSFHVLNCHHCTKYLCYFCSEICKFCTKRFCNNDLHQCAVCNKSACNEDSNKCDICDKVSCMAHVSNCLHCSKFSCNHCSKKCEICSGRFCDNDIKKCTTCQISSCGKDSKKCEICDDLFCVTHYETCGICMKSHCGSDTKVCKICNCAYSSNCVEGDHCNTCNNLKSVDHNYPQVKEFKIYDFQN